MHVRLLMMLLVLVLVGVVSSRSRVGNVSVGEEFADCLGVVGSAVLELALLHHNDVVGLGEKLDLECACLLDQGGGRYDSARCMLQFAVSEILKRQTLTREK